MLVCWIGRCGFHRIHNEKYYNIFVQSHFVLCEVLFRLWEEHRSWFMLIHSSDMSIIHKFLTNQIAGDEIIIAMTPHLHMQEGVNLVSLKLISKFSLKLLRTYYIDVRRWSKWTLGHRRKKRGGGNISSLISYFLYLAWQENYTFKPIFVFSLSNELVEECIETNCSSNVITGDSR